MKNGFFSRFARSRTGRKPGSRRRASRRSGGRCGGRESRRPCAALPARPFPVQPEGGDFAPRRSRGPRLVQGPGTRLPDPDERRAAGLQGRLELSDCARGKAGHFRGLQAFPNFLARHRLVSRSDAHTHPNNAGKRRLSAPAHDLRPKVLRFWPPLRLDPQRPRNAKSGIPAPAEFRRSTRTARRRTDCQSMRRASLHACKAPGAMATQATVTGFDRIYSRPSERSASDSRVAPALGPRGCAPAGHQASTARAVVYTSCDRDAWQPQSFRKFPNRLSGHERSGTTSSAAAG